jgi:hypothetical protein
VNRIVEKIKTRGYWRVVIRPLEYEPARIQNILLLPKVIRECSVQITGWDFPHVESRQEPAIGKTHVEQAVDWEHYVQYWRIYQSGQFVFLGGVWNDWRDQSTLSPPPRNWGNETRLGVGDTAVTLLEVFEFATRLTSSAAGGDVMHVEVGLFGLQNRLLWLDAVNRVPFSLQYRSSISEWSQTLQLTSVELLGASEQRPLGIARELFRRFGWDADVGLLSDMVQGFKLRTG